MLALLPKVSRRRREESWKGAKGEEPGKGKKDGKKKPL